MIKKQLNLKVGQRLTDISVKIIHMSWKPTQHYIAIFHQLKINLKKEDTQMATQAYEKLLHIRCHQRTAN